MTAIGHRGTSIRAAHLAPVGLVMVAMFVATGCGSTPAASEPEPTPVTSAEPVVVTFEVAGGERFRIRLNDPSDIDIAGRLLAGEDAPSIPNGRVIRATGVNEGYSWSIDPDDFEFADVTIEVCDGIPSDVETGVITSDRYCPWSAVVVAIDPAD